MKADVWRIYDLRGGISGPGYHDFLMDEIECGPRVAMAFDEGSITTGGEMSEQTWWVLIGTPSLMELEAKESRA